MWHEGALKVRDSVFKYWVKTYGKGSEYGIDGGRISKLQLNRGGRVVCNYDRGWDVKPEDEDTETALEIMKLEYN